jgi:hypothetical protein
VCARLGVASAALPCVVTTGSIMKLLVCVRIQSQQTKQLCTCVLLEVYVLLWWHVKRWFVLARSGFILTMQDKRPAPHVTWASECSPAAFRYILGIITAFSMLWQAYARPFKDFCRSVRSSPPEQSQAGVQHHDTYAPVSSLSPSCDL